MADIPQLIFMFKHFLNVTRFCSIFTVLYYHYLYRLNFFHHPSIAGTICLIISSLENTQVERYSTCSSGGRVLC